ncbi:MAG: hypothetical protein WCL32_11870 [Planctomycetota bacterium]
MQDRLLLAGLGVSLVGSLVVALADAWLSRLTLIYLDAIEANVANLVQAVRSRVDQVAATSVDPMRDRKENRARTLKTLGWLALVLGFGLQLAACLTGSPR